MKAVFPCSLHFVVLIHSRAQSGCGPLIAYSSIAEADEPSALQGFRLHHVKLATFDCLRPL